MGAGADIKIRLRLKKVGSATLGEINYQQAQGIEKKGEIINGRIYFRIRMFKYLGVHAKLSYTVIKKINLLPLTENFRI